MRRGLNLGFFLFLLLIVSGCKDGKDSSTNPLVATPPAAKTISYAPIILLQPVSATVTSGAATSFLVEATGTAPLSYQWKKNDVAISGAQTKAYIITAASGVDAADYSVTISNASGSVTSNKVQLIVSQVPATPVAPTITTQPTATQTIFVGDLFSLSVNATGTPPFHYQWKRDGAALSGQNAQLLSMPAPRAPGTYRYAVVVSNDYGTVTSNIASLIVQPKVTVPVIAPTITTQPAASTEVRLGTSVNLSVVASGTAPLRYQWKKGGISIANGTGASIVLNNFQSSQAGAYTVEVSNPHGKVTSNEAILALAPVLNIITPPAGQVFKRGERIVFLSAYTGPSNATPWKVQYFDGPTPFSAPRSNDSSYDWIATSEGVHSISSVITFENGDSYRSPVFSISISGLLLVAPTITTQPAASTAVGLGRSVTLNVVASGSEPLTYQWKKEGVSIPGKTSANFVLNSYQGTDAGAYTVEVSNPQGKVTSQAAVLTTGAASYNIVTPAGPQTVAEGVEIFFLGSYTGLINQTPWKVQYFDGATSIANPIYNDSTIRWTATKVGVHPITSVITFDNGDSYRSPALPITVSGVPIITKQPATASIPLGATTSLSVVAKGTPPLGYQWKKGGVPIVGGSGASIVLNDFQSSNAGTYTVDVYNAHGKITSSEATLSLGPSVYSITTPSIIETFLEGSEVLLLASYTGPYHGNSWKVEYFDGETSLGDARERDASLRWTAKKTGVHLISSVITFPTGDEYRSPAWPVTVVSNQVAKVVMTPKEAPVVAGKCIPIVLTFENSSGKKLTPTQDVAFDIWQDVKGSQFYGANFYKMGNCLEADLYRKTSDFKNQKMDEAHKIPIVIPKYRASVEIYYKDSQYPFAQESCYNKCEHTSAATDAAMTYSMIFNASSATIARTSLTLDMTAGPPALGQILQIPPDTSVTEGGTVKLPVKFSGEGPFQVIWLKDGLPVFYDTMVERSPGVLTTRELEIKNISRSASGKYKVRVSTQTGTVDSAEFNLTVAAGARVSSPPLTGLMSKNVLWADRIPFINGLHYAPGAAVKFPSGVRVWSATRVNASGTKPPSLDCAQIGGNLQCWTDGLKAVGNSWNSYRAPGELNRFTLFTGAPVVDMAISLDKDFELVCALFQGGAVRCWSGVFNAMYNGTAMPAPVVLAESGVTDLQMSSVYEDSKWVASVCALVSGALKCRSVNHPATNASPWTQTIFDQGVKSFSTSATRGFWNTHTCAVVQDSVRCWGVNDAGQLGDGSTLRNFNPVTVNLNGGASVQVLKVVTRADRTCAQVKLKNGKLSFQCWGLGATRPITIFESDVTGVTSGSNLFGPCAEIGTRLECWTGALNESGDRQTIEYSKLVQATLEINPTLQGLTSIVFQGVKHEVRADPAHWEHTLYTIGEEREERLENRFQVSFLPDQGKLIMFALEQGHECRSRGRMDGCGSRFRVFENGKWGSWGDLGRGLYDLRPLIINGEVNLVGRYTRDRVWRYVHKKFPTGVWAEKADMGLFWW